jgi:NAD+ diphosphatase
MAGEIVFTASPLDRASHLRRDADWLQAELAGRNARFVAMLDLKPLIATAKTPGGAAIRWFSASEVRELGAEMSAAVYLGTEGGYSHFGVALTADPVIEAKTIKFAGVKPIDVRSIAPNLPQGQAAILAQAKSLLDWHARHGFCATCGAETRAINGGWARACVRATCNATHFPRTDPVVIMLIVRENRCLLGRQPQFAEGVYSALAGFVEPGESIEEAVRRESFEESGVRIGAVRYLASQPWPFPSNLMIGCLAEAETSPITIDQTELQDARWFERAEVGLMVKNSLDPGTDLRLPPPLSLAHQLALRWLGDRLPA